MMMIMIFDDHDEEVDNAADGDDGQTIFELRMLS